MLGQTGLLKETSWQPLVQRALLGFLASFLAFAALANETFQVLHTGEGRFYNARRNGEGQIQVHNPQSLFNRWITIDPRNSPYQTFTEINYRQHPTGSFFQAMGQYHQVERVLRTANGQFFVAARTLQDQDDGYPYHRSPNGTLIHEVLVPISRIRARQTDPRNCPNLNSQYVRAENVDQGRQWAQALLNNASATLNEDRTRRTGSWSGDHQLRYMEQIACLDNGEVILSTEQEKDMRAPGYRNRALVTVYDVINPSTGASRLRFGPSRFWLSASTLAGPSTNIPQELLAEHERDVYESATNGGVLAPSSF